MGAATQRSEIWPACGKALWGDGGAAATPQETSSLTLCGAFGGWHVPQPSFLTSRWYPQNPQVLIFSQMTKMLDLLHAYLEERGHRPARIDGSIPWQERQVGIHDPCTAACCLLPFVVRHQSPPGPERHVGHRSSLRVYCSPFTSPCYRALLPRALVH